MPMEREGVGRARALRERVDELRRETDRTQAELHAVICELAAGGATLREIADALEMSHQRVHQILDQKGHAMLTKVTRRRGRRPGATAALNRLSMTGRVALEIAQEEAGSMQHDFIGTEHMLLGLVRADARIAAALARQGVAAETIREEVIARVGRGRKPLETATKRLQPRLKLALERAVGEAERAQRVEVASVDLLTGIGKVDGSVAAEILIAHGVDLDALAEA